MVTERGVFVCVFREQQQVRGPKQHGEGRVTDHSPTSWVLTDRLSTHPVTGPDTQGPRTTDSKSNN
jgi:hypothetical protein